MNLVILEGKAGRDATVKNVGNDLLRVSICTEERFRDKGGEWKSETEWHDVVAWGKVATDCGGIKKGDHLWVQGRKKTRSYEKGDGTKVTAVEIVADKILALKRVDKSSQQRVADAVGGALEPREEYEYCDVPF